MRSKQAKHKRSNKKRLNKGSNKGRLFIYLILGGIVIGFFLLRESPTEQQRSPESTAKERLKALPYLAWTPAKNASESGVTKFIQEKSLPGINIYKSGDTPEAYLMDMSGKILHTWAAKTEDDNDTWSNIELTDQGNLIAFVNYEKLIRLDWDSNILWTSDSLGFHHDLSISKNEDIYAIARKIEYIPEFSFTHMTANDYITILNKTGELIKSISIAKLLLDANIPIIHEDVEADYPRNTGLKDLISSINNDEGSSFFIRGLHKIEQYYEKITRPKDFFHTNTINIVNYQSTNRPHKLFNEGEILISIRNQNLIAIVNIDKEKITWSWGEKELEHPHDPVMLDNGNILIFDNGYKRKFSRIIELNPLTQEIEWEYKSVPPDDFYSETRGSNQKLANGNILISDSRNGHAFEITTDGEIVWEFYNPEIKTAEGEQQRATIFRMRRLINPEILPLVKDPEAYSPM
jgi:hypothetical protein